MTDDEKFRLDVSKIRFLDRKRVARETVSAVTAYFPEGITLAEIEGILCDIRSELSSGMVTYISPLEMAERYESVAEKYRERIKKMNQLTE